MYSSFDVAFRSKVVTFREHNSLIKPTGGLVIDAFAKHMSSLFEYPLHVFLISAAVQ